MSEIIVLHGAAGSGKSSVAAELERLAGYKVASFADPLKMLLSHYSGDEAVCSSNLWGESSLRNTEVNRSWKWGHNKQCVPTQVYPDTLFGCYQTFYCFLDIVRDREIYVLSEAVMTFKWLLKQNIDEEATTLRELLTFYGDKLRDYLGASWSAGYILAMTDPNSKLVAPDLRYEDELRLLRLDAGEHADRVTAVKIIRDSVPYSGEHKSDQEFPDELFDFVVNNNTSPTLTAQTILGML